MTAVLLALTMVVALAGCGKQATTTSTTEQPSTTTSGSAQSSDKTVDLTALRDKILTDCSITDSVNIDTAALTNVYGIAAEDVANSASFTASSGGAFPQEVVMVQAKDATAAANVQSKLTNRLSEIAKQASSYDPDSQALAEKCTVVTNGVYVALFFSTNYDKMVSDFNSAVQ